MASPLFSRLLEGLSAGSEPPLSYHHEAGPFTDTHRHHQTIRYNRNRRQHLQQWAHRGGRADSPIQASTRGNNWATPSSPSRGQPRRPGNSIITATTASPNPRMAATKSDIFGSLQGRTSLASPPRSKPVLKFKLTELAARTNLEILESYNYDLQVILLEDAHSPLCPGSEFCPTASLIPYYRATPCGRKPRLSCTAPTSRWNRFKRNPASTTSSRPSSLATTCPPPRTARSSCQSLGRRS